jgi:hypothetical protein
LASLIPCSRNLGKFKDILPSGASIAHLSIKTPKDNDWFAQGNVLQQTQNLDNFGERLNVSIVVYSDSEDHLQLRE